MSRLNKDKLDQVVEKLRAKMEVMEEYIAVVSEGDKLFYDNEFWISNTC